MSKGSKRRPMQISQKEWDDKWEAIFGRKKDKTEKREPKSQSLSEAANDDKVVRVGYWI